MYGIFHYEFTDILIELKLIERWCIITVIIINKCNIYT